MRAIACCVGVERDEGVLGEPGDGAVDAAAARVGGEAQAAPVALAPQLEQRGRQQRQGARLALDVGQQRLDELGLDGQADALRRPLDRAPQLLARHRADEHVVGAEQPRELRVGGAAAVEVGAHGEHDDRRRRAAARTSAATNSARSASSRQAVNSSSNWSTASTRCHSRASRRVARRSSRSGCSPGRITRLGPVLAARQHAAGERGQQPGPHDRRLAAARRADDREQRRADEPRDELGDEPLAPEEVLGVGGVEASPGPCTGRPSASVVVAVAAGEAGALARGLELDDAAGQLGLERARLAAAGRRAPGGGVDAPRRLAPRPLARRLVDAARDAAAGREQRLDRDRAVSAVRRVEAGDGAHAAGVERLERDRLLRLQPCERRRLQPGGERPGPARRRSPARACAAPRAPRRARGRRRRPRPARAAASSRARASTASAASGAPVPAA